MAIHWEQLIQNAVAFRHTLHQKPELSWQEQETAQRIRNELSRLGIAWQVCADTGTVARLAHNKNGRHIALRADIDALPIHESSGMAWSSQTAGCMHACGHDGHTATLIAAAHWLKTHEDSLPGPVSLLFQPAEEGGHGAKRMIEDGALEGVDVIYGWHNWPAIPFGQAVCPDGTVMAGNGTFEIVVQGQGGHASQPEACRDPVLAAAAIVIALQQTLSRRLPPQEAAVLSVTSIEASSSPTVIPDKALIGGSFRIAHELTRDRLTQCIQDISTATAAAYEVDCHVTVFPRYGATINHPEPAAFYRRALLQELGSDGLSQNTPLPIMASEDFHYYLNAITGAFALIGTDDGIAAHQRSCHSPEYDFNDKLIDRVARIYARLAGAPLPDEINSLRART
ncbi:N(2)-acetyl-L-2,4-diaminobutanoate deacetylase DoeB2 [Methylotuvimicrobium buryatense]|uniref:Amidohydrolase n=1 Tax=Methylotuvimicrobium buryatense TaxID=95641 RepID=A0A4P9USQ2_METBY|nr:N(2)-acetyl-L-2,4-diaminobutanoate deacetylase DoeB2 [Methylotuvimicrobium buryatense]QCW84568.1 amidohydrolase [Methylotuvimicrobium buryatense]